MGEGFSRSYLPTLGADFAVKKINTEQKRMDIQIWDIGGQTAFKKFVPSFLQNSSSAIFVFDLTEAKSFQNLPSWVDLFRKSNDDVFTQIPLVFIGNKNDLMSQVIDDSMVKELLHKMMEKYSLSEEMLFYSRTSALTGENIDSVFGYLVNIFQQFS